MNIILTGERGCGKSTVVERLRRELRGGEHGFLTRFEGDRSSGERRLIIESLDGGRRDIAVSWHDNIPRPDIRVFDSFARELSGGGLCIIDELGKFEAGAERLREAATAAFDAGGVLAVVRLDALGWMQELKSRKDAAVINVCRENRDRLPGELAQMLRGEKSFCCKDKCF